MGYLFYAGFLSDFTVSVSGSSTFRLLANTNSTLSGYVSFRSPEESMMNGEEIIVGGKVEIIPRYEAPWSSKAIVDFQSAGSFDTSSFVTIHPPLSNCTHSCVSLLSISRAFIGMIIIVIALLLLS